MLTTKSTVEIPTAVRLKGSCDLTCSIIGISDIVAESIAVSPKGEALSPRDPPANTAPITRGILEFVLTASGRAIGMTKAHVPQADPIKYDAAHPIKKIAAGIKNAGILFPTMLVTKSTNPRFSTMEESPQLSISTIMGGTISLPPDIKWLSISLKGIFCKI